MSKLGNPRKTSYPHCWLAKATWRATALKFKVEGKTVKDAQKRAEGRVSRMEGGESCLEVNLISQLY